MSNAYKEAGVDLNAGYESVRLIKQHVKRTKIKGTKGDIGTFGGLFDLSSYNMKEPVLVSGTDGVGTKLLIAKYLDRHDTIGIDAVAMCVNDVLVQHAIPLFFLDYLAVGKNDPSKIELLVKGVADGCEMAECALIGGETAEMPDMYGIDDYDIAGFCVGVCEKKDLLTNSNVEVGDVLIGLSSSGCHSNGFSLIRKVLLKDHGLDLHAYNEYFQKTLGEELLTPTRIYVKPMKYIFEHQIPISGMCHITGGGFYENLPRMLKKGQGVLIQKNAFVHPPIFKLIQKEGCISDEEMYNVFNMGIGFVIAVNKKEVVHVLKLLDEIKESAYVIGEVTDSNEVVIQ